MRGRPRGRRREWRLWSRCCARRRTNSPERRRPSRSPRRERRKLEADAASSDDARASELAELEKLRGELSAALDAANSRAESALGECERLKNELEARESAESRARTSEADAAAAMEAHAEEKATLEKTCEELRAALNASNARVEEIARERDGFKTELEAASSKGDLDELRGELDAEREKTTEMTKKYEETKAALDARGDDLRRARDTESALSAALSDAEAQLVDSRKNVDLIVSRADKASEIFRENAAALRLADARAATAQLEASVAEERVEALEESLREVEEERDACKEERDACKKERDACKEELETLQKQPKLVSPTSPIASPSPAKTSAPIDVVEALEHERRARALFQSDARYWRERYESIANGPGSALTPIPSFASTPKRSNARLRPGHRRGITQNADHGGDSSAASRRPLRRRPLHRRTTPFAHRRGGRLHLHRSHRHRRSRRGEHTTSTIARAFEKSSPRTFDESRASFAVSSRSRATFPRVPPPFESPSMHTRNHILLASIHRTRLLPPRLDRPRPPASPSSTSRTFSVFPQTRRPTSPIHTHRLPRRLPAREFPRATVDTRARNTPRAPRVGHTARYASSRASHLVANRSLANDRIDAFDRRRIV